MGSIERPGENSAEKLAVPLSSPEAQGALMLYEYFKAHEHDAPTPPAVDLLNLEKNDASIASAAMDEWVGGDPSFALLYRELIEKDPNMIVNIHDTEGMSGLLAQLAEEKKVRTLH
jgi:hypothetical protein